MGVSVEVQVFFFFQAEDGIRDLVRSRGLGDVYKRQAARLYLGHRITSTARVITAARRSCAHHFLQRHA